jgi:MFS superfamily sulfate permease-like transporter
MSIPAEMLVLRPRSDIYFANVQLFRREVQAALAARESRPTILVFDASRLSLFEYTAHQAVRDTVSDLRTQGSRSGLSFLQGTPRRR